ncbi:MAG TPA: response regulator transcription factor [Emcibacteraceae bacterium]|nr:response regulator transcription factor [Emcibacteraceae bacterium]
MVKGTILTVDDDENLQEVIAHYLENDGYKLLKAANAQQALEKIDLAEIDIVLLDLGLPDVEGINLIPQMQAKSKAGIIVVSGKSDTTEKIICLEMGADDYMTKPFEMRELSARIKAVFRRKGDKPEENHNADQKDKTIYFDNDWYLDRNQYQLFDSEGNSQELTTGEFKLLEALIMAPNTAISRERLFELTRDGEFEAFDRAIDIQIGRIRKKMSSSDTIKTVRGVGYMFTGKVKKAA